MRIPLEQLHESPSNPNKHFKDPTPDFVSSVRELGVLQPIIARARKGGGHEVIFGHRRWRAGKLAEQGDVPAIVRDVSDEPGARDAGRRNSQRKDTHPVDEADAFAEIVKRGYTAQRITCRSDMREIEVSQLEGEVLMLRESLQHAERTPTVQAAELRRLHAERG